MQASPSIPRHNATTNNQVSPSDAHIQPQTPETQNSDILTPFIHQKIKHAVWDSINLTFTLGLSLAALGNCILANLSLYWVLIIFFLEEALAVFNFSKILIKTKNNLPQGNKKSLRMIRISVGIRFGVKIALLLIIMAWITFSFFPKLIIYIPLLSYYFLNMIFHLIFVRVKTFKDAVVITWKIIRLVLALQLSLLIYKEKQLNFDDQEHMQSFWIGYIGLIIAIPCYVIIFFYSLIVKVVGLFEKHTRKKEAKSIFGFIWIHIAIIAFLALSVYCIDFFTYFSESGQGIQKTEEKIINKEETKKRKNIFAIVSLCFSGFYFLMTGIGFFLKDQIIDQYERIIFESEPNESSTTTNSPNRSTNIRGIDNNGITEIVEEPISPSIRSYGFVKRQGDEYFKVVGQEELGMMKQLDSVAGMSSKISAKRLDNIHKPKMASLFKQSRQQPDFDSIDLNNVREFQERIQGLRERVVMGQKSVGPKFHVLKQNEIEEDKDLGWVGSNELPKAVQRSISPDLRKISLDNQFGEMKKNNKQDPGLSHFGRKKSSDFVIQVQELEDDLSDDEPVPNKEVMNMLDDECGNSMSHVPRTKDTDSVLLEKYAARKERLEKLMKEKKERGENCEKEEAEILNLYETDLCVICIENPRDCIFQPCGHGSCCYSCAEKVVEDKATCHYCRVDIKKVLKIDRELEYDGLYKVVEVFSVVLDDEEEEEDEEGGV